MKIFKIVFYVFLVFTMCLFILIYIGLKPISKYKYYIDEYSSRYGVDNILVISVIKTESNFKPDVKSGKGAVGLMQLVPPTAKDVYIMIYNNKDFKEEMLLNPEINIRMGVYYIKLLSDKFNGNKNLVLAAYNAGPGNVKKWLETNSEIENNPDKIPFEETKKYIVKTKRIYKFYKFITKLKIM